MNIGGNGNIKYLDTLRTKKKFEKFVKCEMATNPSQYDGKGYDPQNV